MKKSSSLFLAGVLALGTFAIAAPAEAQRRVTREARATQPAKAGRRAAREGRVVVKRNLVAKQPAATGSVVRRPAGARSGYKRADGDWRHGGRTVTIDTTGINMGTPEAQAAVRNALDVVRDHGALGGRASPSAARSMNSRLQDAAARLDSVRSSQAQPWYRTPGGWRR